MRCRAEPYRIKMVEPLPRTTEEERHACIVTAGYNTFLLPSNAVTIDLLTDSGTNAMSAQQWAGMMVGDEAYAGAVSFTHLEEAVRDVYGYRHIVPTHQGRGAEHILAKLLIKNGDVIPGNMYFTTTRLHQELAGGTFCDVIIPAAHVPTSTHPFKGDVDIAALRALIAECGPQRIPYLSIAATVNMAGGQPISLRNLREVRAVAQDHRIRVILDIARIAENAFFIQQREPGCAGKTVRAIVRELCDLSDGAAMSAKKDPCCNIGGFLALNDPLLYEEACRLVVIYEGLHTYGGMAGGDMEAGAIGIRESVDDDHIRARVEQVAYLGDQLRTTGIPLVLPVGGHGVYIDAKRFLPHIPHDAFPAQTLAAAVYVDSGIRTMERGIVSAGRNPATGDHYYPKLELVRIAIPRRVYTNAHMDAVAESVARVFAQREDLHGLQMIVEPKYLRFFQARFKPLSFTLPLSSETQTRATGHSSRTR